MRYSYEKLNENYPRQEYYVQKDDIYPGTSISRMIAIQTRVKSLTKEQLSGSWNEVRKTLLRSGGLRDLPITRHSFNDYNHCDLVAINTNMYDKKNEGRVKGIEYANNLGDVIREASLPELGPGGSWTTCMIGSGKNPPQDVAHIQFKSKIAFKLIWVPYNYDTFVLVDDDGNILARGRPSGELPILSERKANYSIVKDSKYARNI